MLIAKISHKEKRSTTFSGSLYSSRSDRRTGLRLRPFVDRTTVSASHRRGTSPSGLPSGFPIAGPGRTRHSNAHWTKRSSHCPEWTRCICGRPSLGHPTSTPDLPPPYCDRSAITARSRRTAILDISTARP